MKSKKSVKKYVLGGIGPMDPPESQNMGPLASSYKSKLGGVMASQPTTKDSSMYYGSDKMSSPSVSVLQKQKQLQNIDKASNIAKGVAGTALTATGLGFLAPVATGLIGLGSAAAAQRAAGKLREPSLETPQAVMQRLQSLSDKTMMDRKLEEYNRSLATGVEAIQMGSGREIGAVPALIRAQQQGVAAAAQEQQARKDQAADILAQAQLQQQGMEEQRYQQELAGLQGQYAAGIQGTLASLGQLGKAAIESQYSNTAEEGMKTPGEFSHKRNPLAIVAKDGARVGEMTGGEIILNPSQTKKISEQSAYMRSLLKKPRFKNG
jgi:hypothetical protein